MRLGLRARLAGTLRLDDESGPRVGVGECKVGIGGVGKGGEVKAVHDGVDAPPRGSMLARQKQNLPD